MSTRTRNQAGNDVPHTTVKPPSSGGKVAVRKTAANKAASHILSPAKGARTLTHRKIKQAVEKVFEARHGTDA